MHSKTFSHRTSNSVLCVLLVVTAVAAYAEQSSQSDSLNRLLVNATDLLNDKSFYFEPGFEFVMAGTTYNRSWFHTDGVLSFDKMGRRGYFSYGPDVPLALIRLSSIPLLGTRLMVWATSDYFTIDYTAADISFPNQSARWVLTYWRGTQQWKFDVETVSCTLKGSEGMIQKGQSFRAIDTETVGKIHYQDPFLMPMELQEALVVLAVVAGLGCLIIMIFQCKKRLTVAQQRDRPRNYRHWIPKVQFQNDHNPSSGQRGSVEQFRGSSNQIGKSEAKQTCVICFEGDLEVEGSCTHRFHLSCLRKWYRIDRCCPYCRQINFSHRLKCGDCENWSTPYMWLLPQRLSSCCRSN